MSACGDGGMPHRVADKRLDAGEKGCGELLILVFKAMKAMRAGEILESPTVPAHRRISRPGAG